jgi:hypothetical protein
VLWPRSPSSLVPGGCTSRSRWTASGSAASGAGRCPRGGPSKSDNAHYHLAGMRILTSQCRQPLTTQLRHFILIQLRREHRAAGLTVVLALMREASAVQRVERQVVENVQREALTPLEEGRAYRRLCDLGTSQQAVARAVGRSQSHVSWRLATSSRRSAGRVPARTPHEDAVPGRLARPSPT